MRRFIGVFIVGSVVIALFLVCGLVITGIVPVRDKGSCSQPRWLTTIQKYLGGRHLKQIAFTTSGLEYPGEVYIINEDGSGLRNLTNHRAYDSFPVWSPDGQQLLFVSHRSGNPDIYVMDADGNNVRQLTNSKREDFDPEWSPDGCQIVYTSTRMFGEGYWEADIYLMNADGSNKRNLSNNQDTDDGFISWAANGQEILYRSGPVGETPRMFVMDLEGNILRGFEKPGEFTTVSPDGRYLAFTDQLDDDAELFILDLETKQIIQLTNDDLDQDDIAWRP